jgi:uncharacterized protein YndB with AHSA1/START domain
MEATTETSVLEREIAIDASPETIWQFFTDPRRRCAGWVRPPRSSPGPAGATASR